MQFIIPNAKHAFNMAHTLFALAEKDVLLMLRGDMVTVFPPDVVTPPVVLIPPETSIQFAFAMKRSSYTLAIRAPIKQRSMKETKMADRRVESRRTRVARAQAAARTETMNNTLRSELVY